MDDAGRFPDDRSDSGVSSLRSASGDERSGSRSSALSAPEEHEPQVRHVHSVQHHSLVMAHPPATAQAAAVATPTHASQTLHSHHQHQLQHQQPPHHYPPPPLLHLPPPTHYGQDLLWNKRFPEEYLERDRLLRNQQILRNVSYSDADLLAAQPQGQLLAWHRREQEVREMENQQLLKEREKERERMEREWEQEREREKERDEQERRRQEKAVHKHFEESLRLANQKRVRTLNWSILNSLPPPARGAPSEHERALAAERLDVRERPYYAPVQRPVPPPTKNDYPPPAHGRLSLSQKPAEKPMAHTGLPKAEPNFNMYNYSSHRTSGYPGPDGKHKPEHQKPQPAHGSLSVSKSPAGPHDRDGSLPTPPPLMSELKNSVIVKHDGKTPHHRLEAKAHLALSPKPRGGEIPAHYLHNMPRHHQLQPPPHHMQQHHPQQPHPQQPQHHPNQHPQHPQHPQHQQHQHQQQLQLHQQQQPQYRGIPPAQQASPSVRSRPHPAPAPAPAAHPPLDRYARQPPVGYVYRQPSPGPAPPAAPSKPKVSSPAPPHFYGKPNAGITSGIPVCRPREPPIPTEVVPLVSKSPATSAYCCPARPPPPAHWRGDPRSTMPPGASPLAAHPAPTPQSYQTQPLDLGVSSERDESDRSPKRRAGPPSNSSDGVDCKKRRIESVGPPFRMECIQQYPPASDGSPLLSRVSEPTPLIASAATTITTMVNTAAYCTSPAPRAATDSPVRIPSADGAVRPPGVPEETDKVSEQEAVICGLPSRTPCPSSSPAPAPVEMAQPAPSLSPKESVTPVRHLKKAWLQRHETAPQGEKEPSAAAVPPTPAAIRPLPDPALSLHAVGSMAVNSITRTKPLKASRKPPPKEPNGHCEDPRKPEDSSSSDQERGAKTPPKRKPPKVKRKKGGGTKKNAPEETKKKKVVPVSESGSESDKESESDKDSDSGNSLNRAVSVKRTANGTSEGNGNGDTPKDDPDKDKDKETRKRGRKPKSSKGDKNGDEDDSKKSRKSKDDPPVPPFAKPPVSQLKKTGESFLQDSACCEVAPKLAKCRECRWTPHQRSKNMTNIFCRFYAFRRLRYTKNGQLAIAGFSDPNTDPSEEDKKLWLQPSNNSKLDIEMSFFLLREIGNQFCDMLQQEKDAMNHNLNEDKTIAWKRVVQGVREMCDVCETTLFNFHWTCGKCGFVVCLDCYKTRAQGAAPHWKAAVSSVAIRERDPHGWLTCTSRGPHDQSRLMLTQIVAADVVATMSKMVHTARALWGVPLEKCDCADANLLPAPSPAAVKSCQRILTDAIKARMMPIKEEAKGNEETPSTDDKSKVSTLTEVSWLPDAPVKNEYKKDSDTSNSDSDTEENFSTLRELLTSNDDTNSKKSALEAVDDILTHVMDDPVDRGKVPGEGIKIELKHFVRSDRTKRSAVNVMPIRMLTMSESKKLYPNIPHSWLCDGKLLRLINPTHPGNYKIFQDQWKRGQPVLFSDVLSNMDRTLWTPESFAKDFGEEPNDLINCITGKVVPSQPMKRFWEGFRHTSKRLKDEHGNPMLLKLKDWPPGDDFAELLPGRFYDLIERLPLREYTHRTGRLNLASRLPDCFVRPDLGPKMYTAYGSGRHPKHGTTNLHLDISDAVNVLVYVSGPEDAGDRASTEAFRAIDDARCDIFTRRRVREKNELPGALWHIYRPCDADCIRDMLNCIAMEKGEKPPPNNDPIHDQSWYLDSALRQRLFREYRVEGYTIVQCLGDAVFIPAGAPHQVRNLHDCIKVAEDFVSPENVSHCFHLTQEFRDLSDTHTNHEDKLQIKNIIYHAIKDSLDCLKKAAADAVARGCSVSDDEQTPKTKKVSCP